MTTIPPLAVPLCLCGAQTVRAQEATTLQIVLKDNPVVESLTKCLAH
jgi:hypothetical protein